MRARVRALVGRGARRLRDDRGAAVAEFAMVSVLLVFLLFGVLQVALLFYVRTVVSSSAADGARWAANADVDVADGGTRASELIRAGLSGTVAADVPCAGTPTVDPGSGLALVEVRCRGSIRSIFLPIGALVDIDIRSHVLKEQRP